MKLSLYWMFSMILCSYAKMKIGGIEDDVKLISNIYNFYKQSSVMFIHLADPECLMKMNIVFKMTLMLSKNKIRTTVINFKRIPFFRNHYEVRDKKVKHPMSVILLTSKEEFEKFAEYSQVLQRHKSINLVLSQKNVGKPPNDVCSKPVGNSFKLKINTKMLVKCYGENVLRQWYSVDGNHTSLYDWATWNPKTGLILKANDTFYTRRANLYGKVLRVATITSSDMSQWKDGKLIGFLGDLQHMLEKSLNFTSKFVKEESLYGTFDRINRNWTGSMGLIVRKEVDLILSDFSMTSLRVKTVDFTTPLFFAPNILYIRRPLTKLTVNWSAHFKPFCKGTWSSIALFMLVSSIFISCFEKSDEKSIDKLSKFSRNFFNIWRIYCQQGSTETPVASSFRLVYFSLFSSAFIIFSVYSAALMSNFAIPMIDIPFSSMEGFVKDGSFKLVLIRHSAHLDFFQDTNDSTLVEMKKLIIQSDKLPLTIQDAFNMVCHERVAFYIPEIAAEMKNINIPCQVIKISTGSYDSIGIVLQKHSQYTSLINYQLTKFRSNGVLNHLRSKNFIEFRTTSSRGGFNRVDFPGVVSLLAITTGGSILGLLIFFIEKIHFYYEHKIEKRRFQTSFVWDLVKAKRFLSFRDQIQNYKHSKDLITSNLSTLEKAYIRQY